MFMFANHITFPCFMNGGNGRVVKREDEEEHPYVKKNSEEDKRLNQL